MSLFELPRKKSASEMREDEAGAFIWVTLALIFASGVSLYESGVHWVVSIILVLTLASACFTAYRLGQPSQQAP